MKRRWIKFIFERNIYVVDLDSVGHFSLAENGRLMFYLPDGKVSIVIHPHSNQDTYQQVLDYIEKTTGQSISQKKGIRNG